MLPTVVDKVAKTVKAVYSVAASSSSDDDDSDHKKRTHTPPVPVLAQAAAFVAAQQEDDAAPLDDTVACDAECALADEESPRSGHQPLFPSEMLWGATDDSPDHGAAIVHILTWDRQPHHGGSGGDGNDSSDSESTSMTMRVGSLCCLNCGFMNFFSASQCVKCDFAFTVSESFIQDELFDGLTVALGLDANVDGAALELRDDDVDGADAALQHQLSFGGADDYASIVVPDYSAPAAPLSGDGKVDGKAAAAPPPVPTRRARQAARRSTKTAASSMVPFASDIIDAFVDEAVMLTGWEPSLTLGIDEGVERYTKRGDSSFLKSSTVLQIGVGALLDLLWPGKFFEQRRRRAQIGDMRINSGSHDQVRRAPG